MPTLPDYPDTDRMSLSPVRVTNLANKTKKSTNTFFWHILGDFLYFWGNLFWYIWSCDVWRSILWTTFLGFYNDSKTPEHPDFNFFRLSSLPDLFQNCAYVRGCLLQLTVEENANAAEILSEDIFTWDSTIENNKKQNRKKKEFDDLMCLVNQKYFASSLQTSDIVC